MGPHLVFALQYEGLDLLFFKQLFVRLPAPTVEEWGPLRPDDGVSLRMAAGLNLRNNRPGVAGFCLLVHKTAMLAQYLARDLAHQVIRGLPPDWPTNPLPSRPA